MKFSKFIEWGLRAATALYPFLTELLALLFWSSKISTADVALALVVITALAVLAFTPRLQSNIGVFFAAAILLIAPSICGIVGQAYAGNDFQVGTFVNLGFAIAWLLYLTVVKGRKAGSRCLPDGLRSNHGR